MIRRFLALAGAGLFLAGCFDNGAPTHSTGSEDGSAVDESVVELGYAGRTIVNSGGSAYFKVHVERQYPGGVGTERFVDCDINGILVGFGGRVKSGGKFTDITAYCRDLNPDGTLGPTYERTDGGSSKESHVVATDGYVVAGIGGVVNHSNLVRSVIRECKYQPETRRLDASTCRLKSSDASTAMEIYYSAHEHIIFPEWFPIVAIQGVGLTAGTESLEVIRFTAVELR